MRFILFLLVLLTFGCQSSLSPPDIPNPVNIEKKTHTTNWRTYYKAFEESYETQKPIFLFFSSKSCGACQVMKKTSLQNIYVKAFLEDQFIPTQVNDKEDEQFFYFILDIYEIEALPSIVIISSFDRKVLLQKTGLMSSEQIMSLMSYGSGINRVQSSNSKLNESINLLLRSLGGRQ